MSLCPICLTNNIQSTLTDIGISNKILICENNDCPYVEDSNTRNINSKLILSSNKNQDTAISLEDETSDLDLNISSTDSESEFILNSKAPVSFTKYSLLSVQRNLELMVKEFNKISLFNWFGCPLMLKFHVKVCYFLIIHLKLFDCSHHPEVKDLKELYYKYEYITGKIQKRLVSLLSFKFMKYLYDKHHVFKLASIENLDMTERILKSFDKFITSLEKHDRYRSIYNYTETCTCCDYKMTYLKENFAIRLFKSNFQFRNNEFFYQSQCKKCFGITNVSIKIERLANFIFLDCSQGTNKQFDDLNEIVLQKSFDFGLKLQAIIELKNQTQVIDVPEKEPSVEEFILKNNIRQVVNYRIIFRNTECWFCIDSKSGIRIDPMKDFKLYNFNIRLLVFGECNNPSEDFRSDFSQDLYRELNHYKNRPTGMLKYPSELIKYSTVMLKYRDFCVQKPKMTKSLFTKISTKVAAKLNCHLKRKEKRLNMKLRELKTYYSGEDEDEEIEDVNNSEGEQERGKKTNSSNQSQSSENVILVTELKKGKMKTQKEFSSDMPMKTDNLASTNTQILSQKKITITNGEIQMMESKRPLHSLLSSLSNNSEDDVLNAVKIKFESLCKSDQNEPLLDELIERKRRKLEEGR